jgi:hypothetical protein
MRIARISPTRVRLVLLMGVLPLLSACSREPVLKADQFEFETIKKGEEAEDRERRSKAKRTIQLPSFEFDPTKTIQGKRLNEELIYHDLYIVELELRLNGREPPSLLGIIFEQQTAAGLNNLSGGSIRLEKTKPGFCRLSGVVRIQGKGEVTMNIRDPRGKGRTIYTCPATFLAAPAPKE